MVRFDDVNLAFGDDARAGASSLSPCGPAKRGWCWAPPAAAKRCCSKPPSAWSTPDSGHISLFGEDITGRKESQLYAIRSKVGILFQEGGLFDSLTIAENVAYPLLNQHAVTRRRRLRAG